MASVPSQLTHYSVCTCASPLRPPRLTRRGRAKRGITLTSHLVRSTEHCTLVLNRSVYSFRDAVSCSRGGVATVHIFYEEGASKKPVCVLVLLNPSPANQCTDSLSSYFACFFICGAADRSGRGKCCSCCCCWAGTIFKCPMYSFLGCEKAKTFSQKGV